MGNVCGADCFILLWSLEYRNHKWPVKTDLKFLPAEKCWDSWSILSWHILLFPLQRHNLATICLLSAILYFLKRSVLKTISWPSTGLLHAPPNIRLLYILSLLPGMIFPPLFLFLLWHVKFLRGRYPQSETTWIPCLGTTSTMASQHLKFPSIAFCNMQIVLDDDWLFTSGM